MWHKQVLEVTLEGQQSVREVHLQDEGFGPMEETGVQVIMMGHTTLTCQRHSTQSSLNTAQSSHFYTSHKLVLST